MAPTLTADRMLVALAKWGLTPKFYASDWRSHNRNAVQGWGPHYGFVVHNFGSDISDSSSLAYLYRGDAARALPGPLSQFAITDDGQLSVIGWGTANHCRSVDMDLHRLVLADKAPLTVDYRPDTNGDSPPSKIYDSNPHYIGAEMTYGAKPTAAQRATCVRLATAIVDALGDGYTGGSVIGHREATTTRSDPVGVPMWIFRRDVNALLAAGPQEEDVPLTDAEIAKIANAVWSAPIEHPTKGQPDWPARRAFWSTWTYAFATDSDAWMARVAAAVVAALPPSTGDLTAEELTAATEAGVRKALGTLDGAVPPEPPPA